MDDSTRLLAALRYFSVSSPVKTAEDGRTYREVQAITRAVKRRAGGLDRHRYAAALRDLTRQGQARVEIDARGNTRVLVFVTNDWLVK